jgi:hypothetical protein
MLQACGTCDKGKTLNFLIRKNSSNMILLYGTYYPENPVREGADYCYPAVLCKEKGQNVTVPENKQPGTPWVLCSNTGRRDSFRFRAAIFMHPCKYHTASCKRKTALTNTSSQNEMENKQADGRAATTKQDPTDGETKSAQN